MEFEASKENTTSRTSLLTEAVQVIALFFKRAGNLLRKSPRLSHGYEYFTAGQQRSPSFARILALFTALAY